MNIIYEKRIKVKHIKFSPRSIFKCMSCSAYNNNPACPPFAPDYFFAKQWKESYKFTLLIKFGIDYNNFESEKRQAIFYLLTKEKEFFNKNKPYAMSLFPGSCNICEECSFEKERNCKKIQSVRPSLDALGIELSSIVKIDFSESVLYSLVFIE